MNIFFASIAALCLLGIFVSLFLQLKNTRGMSQSDGDALRALAKLEKDLENEKREKNELAGKGKELYDRFKNLESEYKVAAKERDNLQKELTKIEAKREEHEKERLRMLEKIEAAERALREERHRVIAQEQEDREALEAERDRLWNDHENDVVATLIDLCKLPHLQFTSFSNTNLPDDFDGSLKPDFLIDFLGQYVIFDAKVSKAQNLQTYIDDQVKKTTEKVKKSGKIYPHIFLVVPTEATKELKKLTYSKDQYTYYIVSRESLSPILAFLKRISSYELAETLDPQKRENIVNIIAELASHINFRNAHELLLTKAGVETLERVVRTDPELATEVEKKRIEKKYSGPSPSDIKRIASSLTEQNAEITSLASPKASVQKKMILEAESVMRERSLSR